MLRSLFFLPSARRSEILQGVFLVERCRRRMDPAAKANKKNKKEVTNKSYRLARSSGLMGILDASTAA